VNDPPTINRDPFGAITIVATAPPLATGAHEPNDPFDTANEANWLRDFPLALKNAPPANTVDLVTTIADTRADTLGANAADNEFVAVSNAAI
jgi:hypothetical protein